MTVAPMFRTDNNNPAPMFGAGGKPMLCDTGTACCGGPGGVDFCVDGEDALTLVTAIVHLDGDPNYGYPGDHAVTFTRPWDCVGQPGWGATHALQLIGGPPLFFIEYYTLSINLDPIFGLTLRWDILRGCFAGDCVMQDTFSCPIVPGTYRVETIDQACSFAFDDSWIDVTLA